MQYSNFEFSLKFLWFFPKIQFQNLISSQYQSFCIEIFSKCNICSCTIIIFWNGNVKCNFSNNKLCLLLFAQRCQASTPPTVKFQITTKLCRCQDVTFKIAEKIRISHIQLRSKRVIIFFKIEFLFFKEIRWNFLRQVDVIRNDCPLHWGKGTKQIGPPWSKNSGTEKEWIVAQFWY